MISKYYTHITNLFKKEKLKEYFHKIVSLKATPSKIAFSLALGIFIGLLFPIGFQTIVAVPIALLFDCNLILTSTATLITNPITVVPIYFGSIKIGEFLTESTINWDQVSYVLTNPSVNNILDLGKEGLIVFITGSFIQALVFSLLFYLITLKTVTSYRKNKSEII